MSKFKVGDRVVCIKGEPPALMGGSYSFIKETLPNKQVELEGSHSRWNSHRFELAPIPPKNLLKDGMRVVLRNNDKLIYLNKNFVVLERWHGILEDYSDDLICEVDSHYRSLWDVAYIYEAPECPVYWLSVDILGKLVWQREDLPVKSAAQIKLEELEATIAEASKRVEDLKKELAQ